MIRLLFDHPLLKQIEEGEQHDRLVGPLMAAHAADMQMSKAFYVSFQGHSAPSMQRRDRKGNSGVVHQTRLFSISQMQRFPRPLRRFGTATQRIP